MSYRGCSSVGKDGRRLRRLGLLLVVIVGLIAALPCPQPAAAQTGPTLTLWPPTNQVVGLGGTNRYFAIYDPDGPGPALPQWLDPSAVTWVTKSPTVMSVPSPGVVYGRLRGTSILKAKYQGLIAKTTVVVSGKLKPYSITTPDGLTRSYLLYLPDSYLGASPRPPTPLVLAFHGGQGSGTIMMYQTQFNTVAAVKNFLVAYPSGVGGHWNAGGCCGEAASADVADVEFVRRLIADVKLRQNVDDTRIFATGFSNGAMLSHRLAFELSDTIAAIAPVGAGLFPGGSFSPGGAPRPLSVLQFMGTTDPDFSYDAVENGITYWRFVNGMAGVPGVTTYTQGIVSCETWLKQGTEVSFCSAAPPQPVTVGEVTYDGGGHAWPGGVKVYVSWADIPTFDIDASWTMWQFFERHAMP